MIKKILPITLIILLAILLRTFQLDKAPPALFGDEVDVGYQAYSILNTGKDLSGRFMPTYIKSLAEYRAPLFIYSAVPFIKLFGLNEWGVRLPAVFWGVLSVLGIYLLTKELFDKKVALLTAFFLTISPWHLQYSRAAFEVTLLLFLLIYGSYFFITFKKRSYNLIVSAILFGLTLYTYSTASVFTPLLLVVLTTLSFKNLLKSKRIATIAGTAFCIVILPIAISIYRGEARERFQMVSIFQESILLDKINLSRVGLEHYNLDGDKKYANTTVEVLFHNKPAIFTQVFALNYLRAFSFDFLFAKGDPNFRHSVQEIGEMYLFELPLLLLGIFILFTKIATTPKLLISSWLLFAPIPASLTYDGGFHATRLILMLPPLLICVGLGTNHLIERLKKVKLLAWCIGLAVVVTGVSFYLHRYYVHYPIETWRWWHVGYKEAIDLVNRQAKGYDTVVINNTYEPALERYLFFTQYDPALFHQQFKGDKMVENILPGIDGFQLNDKVYFGHINADMKANGGFDRVMRPGLLYLVSARDESESDLRGVGASNYMILKTFYNPLGEPIFYLISGK